LIGRAELRCLVTHGYVLLPHLCSPTHAAQVARLAQASIATDPVVGPGAVPGAEALLPVPDARPLPWRWPAPRTARGDCAAWVDKSFAHELPPSLAALATAAAGEGMAEGMVEPAAVADALAATTGPDALAGADEAGGPRTVGLQSLMARFAALQLEVCAYLSDGRALGPRELQLACYEPGNGYQRHTDALPVDGSGADGQRCFTAIAYCNEGWVPAHGGQLRLTLPDDQGGGTLDVAPSAGAAVLFLSGCTQHEVRPSAHARRYALTAWYSLSPLA